jgi:hypothetical protein
MLAASLTLFGCDGGASDDVETTTTTVAQTTTTTSVAPTTTTALPTTTTSTSTTTAVPPLRAPESVGEYLLVVLGLQREYDVLEFTADVAANPSVETTEGLRDALLAQLAEFERVVPPPEAEDYHEELVRQTAAAVQLYVEFADALRENDTARLLELAEESFAVTQESLAIAELQDELFKLALGQRTDPLSTYLLETSELGRAFTTEVEDLFERLDEVFAGDEDFELLISVLEDEAVLLLQLASDWSALLPPAIAVDYHVQQLAAVEGVGGSLQRGAEAARAEDDDALREAFQSLGRLVAAGPQAAVEQQNLAIAALEGFTEEYTGEIAWARVPIDPFEFGLVTDVVNFDGVLVASGVESFVSLHGGAWFKTRDRFAIDGFERMNALLAEESRVIAVGSATIDDDHDAAVWVSNDGTEWERVGESSLSAPGPQAMRHIANGESGYVAVGALGPFDDQVPTLWRSDDLRTWRRVDLVEEGAQGEFVAAVAAGGDRYVAVGTKIWTSEGGRSWTEIDVGDVWFDDVIPDGDGFIAAGIALGDDQDVAVFVSPDGVEWSQADAPAFARDGTQVIFDIAVVGDRFLVAGADGDTAGDGAVIWQSTDGDSWSELILPDSFMGDGPVQVDTITDWGGGLVALGYFAGGRAVWIGFG